MKKYEEQLKNNFGNIRIMCLMLVNFLDEKFDKVDKKTNVYLLH